jgi:hypothetical protein
MSYEGWRGGLTPEAYQRQQDEGNEIVSGVFTAMAGVVLWIIFRTLYILNGAPGSDVNFDGVFSIADIWVCFHYAIHEPAYTVLQLVPYEWWRFFEISTSTIHWAVFLLVAVACWIGIAIALFHAGRYAARMFGHLGRGASVGIGRVQMRLPQLMATDIVIIAAMLVIFGGFGISILIASFS